MEETAIEPRYSTELEEPEVVERLSQEQLGSAEAGDLIVHEFYKNNKLTPEQREAVKKNAWVRRRVSYMMRCRGKTYDSIGMLLGVTPMQVLNDCKSVGKTLAKHGILDVEAERQTTAAPGGG